MKLKGVEKFIEDNGLTGAVAEQVREWGRDALYWHGVTIMDPADIVVVAMGAENHEDLERQFKARIERRFSLALKD